MVNIKEEWEKHKNTKLSVKEILDIVNDFLKKGYVEEARDYINTYKFDRTDYTDEEKKLIAEFWKLKELVDARVLKKAGNKKKEILPTKYINRFVDKEKKIIIEQVYNKKEDKSLLCIYSDKDEEIKYVDEFQYMGTRFLPQEGEELEKKAVLLPSKAEEYNDKELDKLINNFIIKWLDVPDDVVKFGIWNTKRSWVYDKFHNLNYLRALGDTGLGKSRYLNTFGVIHYTPIFTTGSTTPAPLFRILDKWGGTLVMDEADLKHSDESEDIIKIINQGFEKGNFIMRCDQNDASKISFFDPFSPKILATRRTFQDKATESRCITHVMGVTERKDIPVNLNDEFYLEAEIIRNKLLMWRFKNYFKINLDKKYEIGDLEPRVKQIVSSYIALFGDNKSQMKEFKDYIKDYQEDLIEERQQSFEGSIVGAIHSLLESDIKEFSAGDIIKKGEFTGRTGKPMQPRALNSYLKSLGFKKSEVRKIYGKTKRCVPIDTKMINNLFERYGYTVTEVTLVTGSSEVKNKGENELKKEDSGGGGANRIVCNLRNSVSNKIKQFSDEEIKKSGFTRQELEDNLK